MPTDLQEVMEVEKEEFPEDTNNRQWCISSVVGSEWSSDRSGGSDAGDKSHHDGNGTRTWPSSVARTNSRNSCNNSINSSKNICDLCGRTFVYAIALKQHITKVHGSALDSCDGRLPNLQEQTNNDGDGEDFGDGDKDDCSAGGSEDAGLAVTEPPPLHICNSCGKAFASAATVRAHNRLCSRIINLKETTEERKGSYKL